jgi:hypothetical protein
LLHDDVRPHTANHTVETVNELRFEVMEHPPYSPNHAPSDFHMFGPIKESLRERRFSSDEEVIGAVQNWLKTQPVVLFLTELKRLKHWNLCIEVEGDCVEK